MHHFQESVTFGYNCARGKCDLFSTGRPTRLGWVGEQVQVLFPDVILCLKETQIYEQTA